VNFALFQKPSRYFNAEWNACYKAHRSADHVNIALAFPDTYEVGMSHLGLRILYDIINRLPFAAAERVFAPWPDFEEHLRKTGESLRSLEGQRPLSDFDILGFSLQYELSYTTVLNMLHLAAIPFRSAERASSTRNMPLVIAGGPCTVNPAPMADFMDAFLIGEGEEAIEEILSTVQTWKREGGSRDSVLQALAMIAGVYVPSVHGDGARVVRRIVDDLDSAPFPTNPVVPYMQVVHDRITIEISRGCARGCRYCQAGMIYRPLRERKMESIIRIARESIRSTGHGEVSLSSLSAGDYSHLPSLVRSLNCCFAGTGTALSLPSLRVGAVRRDVLREIRSVRKTGFTMAPEAATARLRAVINKDFSDEAYEAALHALFGEGWRTLKLYFMIGLPTEHDDDIRAIGTMAQRALSIAKNQTGRFVNISVTVSPFVPKPHTPFQWCGQEPFDELRRKLVYLRQDLSARKFKYKGHDVEMSLLEAVFSRGDSALSHLIEKAWQLGCRLDGWSEHFDFGKWQDAMHATGIDGQSYAGRSCGRDERLPWEMVDTGISREFLWKEHERAMQGAMTPDCSQQCSVCGLRCSNDERAEDVVADACDAQGNHRATANRREPSIRVRVGFSKTGRLRYLSHLELMTALVRGLRRASIPVILSGGFHPKPELSFGQPLGVGIAGKREWFDMEVSAPFQVECYKEALQRSLPEGISIGAMEIISSQEPSLGRFIKRYKYCIGGAKGLVPEIEGGLAKKEPILAMRDGREVDLSACIESVRASEGTYELMVREDGGVSVRIAEIIDALFGMPLRELDVTRAAVYGWKDGWVEPL